MAKTGHDYAPTSAKPKPVVKEGEFNFAAAHLDHGHIYGQTNGLLEAGGTLKYVYDTDPTRVSKFLEKFPQAKAVSSLDEILEDDSIHMVAAAAIPSERGPIGCKVMKGGKDYFTDKCPFTSLDQLAEARKVVAETGRKYMVYYSERVHVEGAWYAGDLIKEGAIGDIVHISICGPHRLSKNVRPDWFFEKARYGGILTDICSHQADQHLFYTNSKSGKVNFARVENFANKDKPEFEDFGEASFELESGASGYSRVDWFTPDGLPSWGDGRSVIIGTKGFIEIRKYLDLGRSATPKVFLCDNEKTVEIDVQGKVGFPFFGQLILDSLNRTENAMTQDHAYMASELSLTAQQMADKARYGK